MLLHGETTHTAMGLLMDKVTQEMVKDWADARLVIVDEISFMNVHLFNKMYRHVQQLTSKSYKPYGGLNFIFLRDYSQLSPPGSYPIYEGPQCITFHNKLNMYIELDGLWHFKNDLPWGHCNLRFRNGRPTLQDIKTINKKCLITKER